MIGIFGWGTMGKALQNYFNNFEVKTIYYHPSNEKSASLEEILTSDILFICVKPGQINQVIDNLAPVSEKTIIVSILAGVPYSYFQQKFPNNRVVRTMLTYPSLIFGQSKKPDLFSSIHIEELTPFFNIILIEGDEKMDKITATIGCGPAFISYLIKSYQGRVMKIVPDLNEELVKTLIDQSLKFNEWDDLIKKVACKDGATEQALKVLENSNLEGLIDETIEVAYRRAEKFRLSFF